MYNILPLEISGLGESLVWILLLVVFGLPAYFASKSAQKGVSKHEALLPCAACKTLIPATATVCPHCRRRAGHDVHSAYGKKLYYNIKSNRFLKTYITYLFIEIIVIPVIIIMFREVFGIGK